MSANIRGDESVSGCLFYFGTFWSWSHGVIVLLLCCAWSVALHTRNTSVLLQGGRFAFAFI